MSWEGIRSAMDCGVSLGSVHYWQQYGQGSPCSLPQNVHWLNILWLSPDSSRYDKPFPDAFVIILGYAQILYSSCSRYHSLHWPNTHISRQKALVWLRVRTTYPALELKQTIRASYTENLNS